MARIVEVIRKRYEGAKLLGEEDGFTLFGISDRGVNFVIALVQLEGAPGKVVEVDFVARFVGFPADHRTIESMNRNLHLSIAALEAEGDVYLLAAVEASGAFREEAFSGVLDAWRRDLAIALQSLSGGAVTSAFPAARLAAARRFSTNASTSQSGGSVSALFESFLDARASMSACARCGGRGKTGLIARECAECGGAGFVAARKAAR